MSYFRVRDEEYCIPGKSLLKRESTLPDRIRWEQVKTTSKGVKTNGAEERGWLCAEAVRKQTERENESAAAALAFSKDRCFS